MKQVQEQNLLKAQDKKIQLTEKLGMELENRNPEYKSGDGQSRDELLAEIEKLK